MAKRNNALENMKKWMEVIPQCLQPQNKQSENEVKAKQSDKPLPSGQRRVLSFIKNFISENKYPPTRGEIAEHFKWKSANAAQTHIEALTKKGFLIAKVGISRGLVVTGKDSCVYCRSCNRQLTDDEIYVCDECVNEYPHLEVMEIVKGEGDAEAKATAL
ncbi:hypothetical protein R2S03_08040 [Hafnia alvei]|uniref:LexA family protein n=1 Tax=Proteus vulgaris TaxID=585 RepID=UPI00299D5A23|nr:hypothetical protein [Proteus vulgaris]WOO51094.1 hypothetical protein R2S03_08040 [Hafnia alvei]WPF05566.1 hypothetical protein SB028_06885 [Proteus vulgaris]